MNEVPIIIGLICYPGLNNDSHAITPTQNGKPCASSLSGPPDPAIYLGAAANPNIVILFVSGACDVGWGEGGVASPEYLDDGIDEGHGPGPLLVVDIIWVHDDGPHPRLIVKWLAWPNKFSKTGILATLGSVLAAAVAHDVDGGVEEFRCHEELLPNVGEPRAPGTDNGHVHTTIHWAGAGDHRVSGVWERDESKRGRCVAVVIDSMVGARIPRTPPHHPPPQIVQGVGRHRRREGPCRRDFLNFLVRHIFDVPWNAVYNNPRGEDAPDEPEKAIAPVRGPAVHNATRFRDAECGVPIDATARIWDGEFWRTTCESFVQRIEVRDYQRPSGLA